MLAPWSSNSLFGCSSALVVTRLIFDFLLAKNWLTSLPMLHLIRATKLDFMALAKPAFILSWTIILVGVGYGVFVRGHKMLGVDFAGGDSLVLRFNKGQKVEVEKLREAMTKQGITDPMIQYQAEMGGGAELLRITSAFGTGAQVQASLEKAFPDAKFARASLDKVGPTIGAEIQRAAVTASLTCSRSWGSKNSLASNNGWVTPPGRGFSVAC